MIWPHVLVSVFAVIATTNVDLMSSAPLNLKDPGMVFAKNLHLDVELEPSEDANTEKTLPFSMNELTSRKNEIVELMKLDNELGSAFERIEKLKDDLYLAVASTTDSYPRITMVGIIYDRYVMLRGSGRQIEALMELLELDEFVYSYLWQYYQSATVKLNSLYDQTISRLNDNQRLQLYGDLSIKKINMSASNLNRLLQAAKKENPNLDEQYDQLLNEVDEGRRRLLAQVH